jgi:hypothetical protein
MMNETEAAIEQFAVLVDQHIRGSHPPLIYQIDLALAALKDKFSSHSSPPSPQVKARALVCRLATTSSRSSTVAASP